MSIYLLCLLIPNIINPYKHYDEQCEYILPTSYRTLLQDLGKGTTYYSVIEHVLRVQHEQTRRSRVDTHNRANGERQTKIICLVVDRQRNQTPAVLSYSSAKKRKVES